MIRDWDDAYANAPHIPGAEGFEARWERDAPAFRAAHPPEVLAYGAHPRERIDLFRPERSPRGLVVFVHGGYWKSRDRSLWSHLAAGPLGRGWAVAMPGYVLAPEARIAAIGRGIARAVAAAAEAMPGPVVLAGHSAGGHLVVRQVCADGLLPAALAGRVLRAVSISGVHDLRPLLRTALNAELRLDAREAAAESPALLAPGEGVRLHAWVGGAERPEFLRQSALLANVWTGLGAETSLTVAPGRHHFDVIDPLTDPDSDLVAALIGE
jgi:acetyl esterase/lipase